MNYELVILSRIQYLLGVIPGRLYGRGTNTYTVVLVCIHTCMRAGPVRQPHHAGIKTRQSINIPTTPHNVHASAAYSSTHQQMHWHTATAQQLRYSQSRITMLEELAQIRDSV